MKRILVLLISTMVVSFSVSSCFLFGSGSNSESNSGSNSGSNSSTHPMVGTWSYPSWSFTIKSDGTADVVIGDNRFSCQWEEIDSRQGIVVGPCGREYFVISPSGTLYTTLGGKKGTALMDLKRK